MASKKREGRKMPKKEEEAVREDPLDAFFRFCESQTPDPTAVVQVQPEVTAHVSFLYDVPPPPQEDIDEGTGEDEDLPSYLEEEIDMDFKRYFTSSSRFIPPEAYTLGMGATCTLVAVDSVGHLFLKFPLRMSRDVSRMRLWAMTATLSQVYNDSYANVAIKENQLEDLRVGELLVARVPSWDPSDHRSAPFQSNSSYPYSQFCRVEVIKVYLETRTVLVMDVDRMILMTQKMEDLFWMMKGFYMYPLMGLKCNLSGFSEFHNTTVMLELIKYYCSRNSLKERNQFNFRVAILQPTQENESEDDVPSVVIYFSEPRVESISTLNVELERLILNWNRESWRHFRRGMVLCDTKISLAEDDGDLWVQFQSSLMQWLSRVQPFLDLVKDYSKHEICETVRRKIVEGKLLFCKMTDDGEWRRVTVVGGWITKKGVNGKPKIERFVKPKSIFKKGAEPDGECQTPSKKKSRKKVKTVEQETSYHKQELAIQFLDYGGEEHCYLQDLYPVSYFPKFVEDLPPQAFKAHPTKFRGELQLEESSRSLLTSRKSLVQINKVSETEDVEVLVHFLCKRLPEQVAKDKELMQRFASLLNPQSPSSMAEIKVSSSSLRSSKDKLSSTLTLASASSFKSLDNEGDETYHILELPCALDPPDIIEYNLKWGLPLSDLPTFHFEHNDDDSFEDADCYNSHISMLSYKQNIV